MTTILKDTDHLIVPPSVRRLARMKPGDKVEFKATPGVITIVARPVRGEEETPAQRRAINARLTEGLEDLRNGRVSRRFDTVDEMLASLKGEKASRRKKTLVR